MCNAANNSDASPTGKTPAAHGRTCRIRRRMRRSSDSSHPCKSKRKRSSSTIGAMAITATTQMRISQGFRLRSNTWAIQCSALGLAVAASAALGTAKPSQARNA